MKYWLLKSEPNVWSIINQKKAGLKGATWDGVRNYQAANNLKNQKDKYDLAASFQKTMEEILYKKSKVAFQEFNNINNNKNKTL